MESRIILWCGDFGNGTCVLEKMNDNSRFCGRTPAPKGDKMRRWCMREYRILLWPIILFFFGWGRDSKLFRFSVFERNI